MSKYKIVYIQGGLVGNRLVAEIEAEDATQAQYLFYMKYGYGVSIESVTLVEDDNDSE